MNRATDLRNDHRYRKGDLGRITELLIVKGISHSKSGLREALMGHVTRRSVNYPGNRAYFTEARATALDLLAQREAGKEWPKLKMVPVSEATQECLSTDTSFTSSLDQLTSALAQAHDDLKKYSSAHDELLEEFHATDRQRQALEAENKRLRACVVEQAEQYAIALRMLLPKP